MLWGTEAYERSQESSGKSFNRAYLHFMKASLCSDRDEAEPDWSAGMNSNEKLIQSKDGNTGLVRNKSPHSMTPTPTVHTLSVQHAFWK